MLLLETIAVIFSLIYVVLAAKENKLCWAASIISVSLYIYICHHAGLYAETGLQIFYLMMAFYGMWNWSKKQKNKYIKVTEWSYKKHGIILISGALLTLILGFYFTTYTNAKLPILDSFTTVFSLFATYMVVNKVLENWIYWIVIDLVSVNLYYSRELEQTAVLFIIYTIIAVFGYFSWIKKIKANA